MLTFIVLFYQLLHKKEGGKSSGTFNQTRNQNIKRSLVDMMKCHYILKRKLSCWNQNLFRPSVHKIACYMNKTLSTKTAHEHQMTPKTMQLAHAITNNEKQHSESYLRVNQRRTLSKAITLIESTSRDHIKQGDLLLNYLLEVRGIDNIKLSESEGTNKNKDLNSFRIGIAGAPGAGKKKMKQFYLTNLKKVLN